MKPLPQTDIYQEALTKYVDTSFTKSLEKEWEVKPYHIRYRVLYYVALSFTFLFNFLSFSTGSILVFFFLSSMLFGWLAGLITFALAVLLEVAKRKTVSVWAKNFFLTGAKGLDLLLVIIFLSSISIAGSYFGADKGIKEFTPDYENVEADTLKEVIALKEQIAIVKNERAKLASNTDSKGTIFYNLQPAVNAKDLQITALENEVLDIKKEYRTTNTTDGKEHATTLVVTAANVALIAIGCELLFLLLAGWCKYYRFNSYKVLSAIQQAATAAPTVGTAPTPTPSPSTTPTPTNPAPTNSNPEQLPSKPKAKPPTLTPEEKANAQLNEEVRQLKHQRAKLKKQRSAWNSKLKNNEGTDETNRGHLKRLDHEIGVIEDRMRELKGES